MNHYYDATDGGAPRLNVRPVSWRDNWPTVGDPLNPSRSVGHGDAYMRLIERTTGRPVVNVGCGYEGADLALGHDNAADACQQWQYGYRGNGTSSLLNRYSNKIAEVAACDNRDGGRVAQWGWIGFLPNNDCQRWSFTAAGDGHLRPARARTKHAQRRGPDEHASAAGRGPAPAGGRARRDRRPVRQQRRRRHGPAPGGDASQGRPHLRRARAARAHHPARRRPRVRRGATRPGGVPPARLGCGDGGIHRPDLRAGRVHPRLRPRAARAINDRSAHAGRPVTHRPAAVRHLQRRHGVPAGRRCSDRRLDPGRRGRRHREPGHDDVEHVRGSRGGARPGADGLPRATTAASLLVMHGDDDQVVPYADSGAPVRRGLSRTAR